MDIFKLQIRNNFGITRLAHLNEGSIYRVSNILLCDTYPQFIGKWKIGDECIVSYYMNEVRIHNITFAANKHKSTETTGYLHILEVHIDELEIPYGIELTEWYPF